MKIILTRPYDDSLKTKREIESAGPHECFIEPLLQIEFLPSIRVIPVNATIIVTSLNGVRALSFATPERNFNIIAVGLQSAEEARNLGFANVISASDEKIHANAENLLRFILNNYNKKTSLYHVSGEVVEGDLEKKLKSKGYDYHRLVLYKANPKGFTADFIALLKTSKPMAFTFFSPRTASIFADELSRHKLADTVAGSVAFCFSEKVKIPLLHLPFRQLYIPSVTNTENFVKLLQDYKGDVI